MDPLPLGRCSERTSCEPARQCSRWASLVCSHCQQAVCIDHQRSHQQEVQAQAEELNNEVNDLRQVLHALTHEQMIEHLQDELDRWANRCKAQIDQRHAEMNERGVNLIEQLNIEDFRSSRLRQIDADVGQPLIGLLRSPEGMQVQQIKELEQRLEQIRNEIAFLQITGDGQLMTRRSIIPYVPTSLRAKHALQNCPGALAGSSPDHHYLLIFQKQPSFSLILIDENGTPSHTPIDSFVFDLCWCSSKQLFFIATTRHLCTFQPVTRRLSRVDENLSSTGTLSSLACHGTDLYTLSTPDLILSRREMNNLDGKTRVWTKTDILDDKTDRTVGCVRIDEHTGILALSIGQVDHRWRVDLFSVHTMQRLHLGSTFELNSEHCVLVPLLSDHRQWLVQAPPMILLNEQAQVISQIERVGHAVTLVGHNMIAILDHTGIEVYDR